MNNLRFIEVDFEGIEVLRRYLANEKSGMSDFMPFALALWQGVFKNEYAVCGDCLVLRSADDEGGYMYNMPFFPGCCESFGGVLCKLGAGQPNLGLFPLSEEGAAAVARLRPDAVITPQPYRFDYIYAADDLIGLAGKKYHGKRNHIAKFLSLYPDYEFVPLETFEPEKIRAFLREKFLPETVNEPETFYENTRLIENIHRVKDFGVLGAVLTVGDRVAGFSIGDFRHETFFVHVEKADKEIPGAYPMLSNLFLKAAKQRYPGMKYVNREEDMGDEGLKKSKESYNPIKKLVKYKAEIPI